MYEDEVKVTWRLPRTLKDRLEREAKADHRSVNSLVVRALSLCDYHLYRRGADFGTSYAIKPFTLTDRVTYADLEADEALVAYSRANGIADLGEALVDMANKVCQTLMRQG